MRAVRIDAPHQLHSIRMLVPRPQADEVLVRVDSVGICGSDLELLSGTRPAPFASYPIVPGHEWAGRVAVPGDAHSYLRPGDPVVAEGFRYCGRCSRCEEGHTNLCASDYAETGFTHPGAFAEYICVPERLLHRLPVQADLSAAAVLEPAACVAEGLLGVEQHAGMDVAVVGSGTLGLIAVQLLKLASPARLVMVGSRPSRLQVAKELGADLAVEATDAVGVAQIEGQFDLVFEAASRPEGTSTALRLARRGGTVVLEGIYGAGSSLSADSIIALKQLSVQGVFGASRRAWQWILHLFALGSLDLRALVTHRLPLDDVGAAFAVLGDRTSNVIKVQMTP